MTKGMGLRNIGPVTEGWLRRIGVTSAAELHELGADEVYRRLLAAGHEPHRNLYYALVGALTGTDWRIVAAEERADRP